MIKFEHTQVVGWEPAIRGMRNPKNSWAKSDTVYIRDEFCDTEEDLRLAQMCGGVAPIIGKEDLRLMRDLVKAGTDHRKFLRMIVVYVDITAPRYWWTEFDTYKVGTVANSCSTMHKIADKEFTLDDFSHEHLMGIDDETLVFDFNNSKSNLESSSLGCLEIIVGILNHYRNQYLETEDKCYWWQMIQLLPQSYNQKRTVMMNYEVLANIYKKTSRRYHKLDEWNVDCEGSFCQWIESLPYAELITGGNDGQSN